MIDLGRAVEFFEDKTDRLSATNLCYLWCVVVLSVIVFHQLYSDKLDFQVLELFCAVCFGGLGIKKFFDRPLPDATQQTIIQTGTPAIATKDTQ